MVVSVRDRSYGFMIVYRWLPLSGIWAAIIQRPLTLIFSIAKTAATKKTVTKRPAKKAAPKRVKKTAAKRPAKKGGKKAAAKKAAPAKWFRPLIGFCTEWVIDVILFCY